ncbi:MAG: Sulfate permease CysP [Promethearchaeota archaeon]|nr:MAG: Sulfate permease CysP [Candidatus Lokiarchaeota archaeon]
MNTSIILIIFTIFSVFIAFSIGANDETFSTVHGSRTLKMKEILVLTTILAVLGAFLLGRSVSETVGKELLNVEVNDALALTILISTAIWLIISSILGVPISTTHSTIGSIIGVGLLISGIQGVNWIKILEMGFWWVLSPVIGYIVSYIVYKLIHKTVISKLNGFKDFERTERNFSYILVAIICLTAFSRAGNDCSNAVGIVVGIGIDLNFILIIAGISFSLGIIVLGRTVIKSVGDITELVPSSAFASQVPTAIILFVGTFLGIPLSGSHMLVASLLGLAKARRAPVKKGLWKTVLIWVLTFPMAAILAIFLFAPIDFFI